MKIGGKDFNTKAHTYVMGILNVTPDSFSDGGKWMDRDAALKRVEVMLSEGMDILDIGGESTRPGYTEITADEEIGRVVPVIEAVKKEFDVPVSLDTCRAVTAEAGIKAGVDLINDVWGLKKDERMASVIAKSGLPCVLMHNRDNAGTDSIMQTVDGELAETFSIAEKAGIDGSRIILDPGIGFGKTYEENLVILNHLQELNMFGYPILLGASRKSVIGEALGLPVEERLEGTLVTTVFAVRKGCSFIRVHDIKENVRAVRMAEAILGRR